MEAVDMFAFILEARSLFLAVVISFIVFFAYWIFNAAARFAWKYCMSCARSHFRRPGRGFFGWLVKFVLKTNYRKELIRQSVVHCDIQPNDSVLEVGFGPGFGLKFAAEYVKYGTGKVYGLDFSPEMVKEATKYITGEDLLDKVEIKLGDIYDLPYEDKSMDIIFHLNCFYYWDDRLKAITSLHRVLKDGGKMLTALHTHRTKTVAKRGLLTEEQVNLETYMDELKLCNFCDVKMEEFEHPNPDYTYGVIYAYKRNRKLEQVG